MEPRTNLNVTPQPSKALGGEEEPTVELPVVLRVLDIDVREPLPDRPGGLVGREDALARRGDLVGVGDQLGARLLVELDGAGEVGHLGVDLGFWAVLEVLVVERACFFAIAFLGGLFTSGRSWLVT